MNEVEIYINELVKEYNYEKLSYDLAIYSYKFYRDNLPTFLKLDGDNIPLYSKQGTKIFLKYDRIVIGDYGAFIEINNKDVLINNIHMPNDQMYRLEKKYFNNIKYLWYTSNDFSNCKIYYQIRQVSYANYRPTFFYISPYEVEV